MKKLLRSLTPPIVLALAVAGCSGGGSPSTPVVAPSAAAGAGTRPTATSRVSIFIPSATAASQSTRRPTFVSPSTNGITVRVSMGDANLADAGVDLSASSPACTAVANGRSCTISIPVVVGNDTLTFTTYDLAPSAAGVPVNGAKELGTASLPVAIQQGVANNVAVAIGGLVASLAVTRPPAIFGGAAGTERVTVTALDADHNIILAGLVTTTNGGVTQTDTYANPVTVSVADTAGAHTTLDVDGGTPAASVTVTKSSDVVTAHYDGAATSPYHAIVTAAAGGATSATARFAPLFLAASGTNATAFTVTGGMPGIALTSAYEPLSLTASEDVTPPATFTATIGNRVSTRSTTPCYTGSFFNDTPTVAGTSTTFPLTSGRFNTSGAGCTLQISDGNAVLTVPATVSAAAATLYTAFASSNSVVEYDVAGAIATTTTTLTDTHLKAPVGVAHDPFGTVYATSTDTADALVAFRPGIAARSYEPPSSFGPTTSVVTDDATLDVLTGATGGPNPGPLGFVDTQLFSRFLASQLRDESAEPDSLLSLTQDGGGDAIGMATSRALVFIALPEPVVQSGYSYLAGNSGGIASDAIGDVYVADGSTITEYAPPVIDFGTALTTKATLTLPPGFEPTTVTVDGNGDVYSGGTTAGIGQIVKIPASGLASIVEPALPNGAPSALTI